MMLLSKKIRAIQPSETMQKCIKTALLAVVTLTASAPPLQAQMAENKLVIASDSKTGEYTILVAGDKSPILKAAAAVQVNGAWIKAAAYPKHQIKEGLATGVLGEADTLTLTYSGLKNAPDLSIILRSYLGKPFGDLQVTVKNSTGKSIQIDGIRSVDGGSNALDLGSSHATERVLNDSFSEDRPGMRIHDFSDSEKGMHRAVGSQIVYNLANHRSWFIGTLSSDKFLTVLRLHANSSDPLKLDSYEVDATGTTELLNENSLGNSPPQDHVILSLPLESGASLSAERVLFSVASDPVQQLETYGRLIRDLHHARVSAPVPLGWWSWTAYYFGLNEGAATTNAEWLSQNLKKFGYTYFHIDEGYQYARGEYGTPDATLFPHGFVGMEHTVTGLGLTGGIWTAPFEISERSYVYEKHRDWLIKNASGEPIHIGTVSQKLDPLYALDATNPGAQQYLRETYATLTKQWNIRYIKLDFMEDSAPEGYYYQPHTTALEAQRIGLKIIREAVGDSVMLDKDGCEMMNPVGIVDMGRISQDTGHSFQSSKAAATGIAARFYMNRNYFVADPDAFNATTQTLDDRPARPGRSPLTSSEAKVSVVLSAVSGGLFEIGDDLPSLGRAPDRLAWLKNRDLLDMVKLGRAAKPLDLLTYAKEDGQPSLFLLKESSGQSMLAVFNWSETERTHDLSAAQLGLNAGHAYEAIEVLDPAAVSEKVPGTLHLTQPPHSVRLIKLVDTTVPGVLAAPVITAAAKGATGEGIEFSSADSSETNPVVEYRWNFGDGTSLAGQHVTHAFTRPGSYDVTLTVVGLGGAQKDAKLAVAVSGPMATRFRPEMKKRLPVDAQ